MKPAKKSISLALVFILLSAFGPITIIKVAANAASDADAQQFKPVAACDDWIYFSDWDSSTVFSLYKMRHDGTEKTFLTDRVSNIAVAGEWIYYINSDTSGLHKIKTDGSMDTEIASDMVFDAIIDGEWIYYSLVTGHPRNQLYKIKTDGTEKTILTPHGGFYLNIYDGWIYYTAGDDHWVYKIRADGTTDRIKVDPEIWGNWLNVENGWIYTEGENSAIVKMRVDGAGRDVFYLGWNIQPMYLEVAGDWMYFIKLEHDLERGAICKMRIDGTEEIELFEIDYYPGGNPLRAVIGDWIYFAQDVDNSAQYGYLYRLKTDGSILERLYTDEIEIVFEIPPRLPIPTESPESPDLTETPPDSPLTGDNAVIFAVMIFIAAALTSDLIKNLIKEKVS